MGYIYEGMDRAKEAIRSVYGGVEEKYRPIWDIIDRRWQNQLHKPIHAAACFLNPAFHFHRDLRADREILSGLYTMIEQMLPAVTTQMVQEIDAFTKARGDFFAHQMCKDSRTTLMPGKNIFKGIIFIFLYYNLLLNVELELET